MEVPASSTSLPRPTMPPFPQHAHRQTTRRQPRQRRNLHRPLHSPEGKARSAQNSRKHGFTASLHRRHLEDAPTSPASAPTSSPSTSPSTPRNSSPSNAWPSPSKPSSAPRASNPASSPTASTNPHRSRRRSSHRPPDPCGLATKTRNKPRPRTATSSARRLPPHEHAHLRHLVPLPALPGPSRAPLSPSPRRIRTPHRTPRRPCERNTARRRFKR